MKSASEQLCIDWLRHFVSMRTSGPKQPNGSWSRRSSSDILTAGLKPALIHWCAPAHITICLSGPERGTVHLSQGSIMHEHRKRRFIITFIPAASQADRVNVHVFFFFLFSWRSNVHRQSASSHVYWCPPNCRCHLNRWHVETARWAVFVTGNPSIRLPTMNPPSKSFSHIPQGLAES